MAYRSRSRSRGRSSYGKKRGRSSSRSGYKSVKPTSRIIRGYTRAGGNYGRFQGTMSKPELKWFDLPASFTQASFVAKNVGASGYPLWLVPGLSSPTSELSWVLIPQGPGVAERIGRKVTLRHVDSRLRIHLKSQSVTPAGDTAPAIHFRWIIAIDHQSNGADPQLLDIFAAPAAVNTPGGDQLTVNCLSQRNLQYLKRFTILCDKHFSWTAKSIAASSVPAASPLIIEGFAAEKRFTSVLNLPIQYDNTSGTPSMSNVASNNIFGVLLADTMFSGTDLKADCMTRLRFSDA